MRYIVTVGENNKPDYYHSIHIAIGKEYNKDIKKGTLIPYCCKTQFDYKESRNRLVADNTRNKVHNTAWTRKTILWKEDNENKPSTKIFNLCQHCLNSWQTQRKLKSKTNLNNKILKEIKREWVKISKITKHSFDYLNRNKHKIETKQMQKNLENVINIRKLIKEHLNA